MKLTKRMLASLERLERSVDLLVKGDRPGHPFRGNQHAGGRGGRGGGSGGIQPIAKHSVKLPKNPKKLNTKTAFRALEQMGIRAELGKYDLQKKQARYKLTDKDGNSKVVSSKELGDLVYGNQKQ